MEYLNYTSLTAIESVLEHGFMFTLREFSGLKVQKLKSVFHKGCVYNHTQKKWIHYEKYILKPQMELVDVSIKALSDLMRLYKQENIKSRKIEEVNTYYSLGNNPNCLVASRAADYINPLMKKFVVIESSKHTAATFDASRDNTMWGKELPHCEENQAILYGVGGETDRQYLVEFPSKWAKQAYFLN